MRATRDRRWTEAFAWGFFLGVIGLLVVAITRLEYVDSSNPLASAVYGLVLQWALLSFLGYFLVRWAFAAMLASWTYPGY